MESDTQDRRIGPGSLRGPTGRTGAGDFLFLSVSLSLLLREHPQSLTRGVRSPCGCFGELQRALRAAEPRAALTGERRIMLNQRPLLVAGSVIKRSSFCSMFVFFYEMSCISLYFSSVCPIDCIYLSVCKSETSYTMSYYSTDIQNENYTKCFTDIKTVFSRFVQSVLRAGRGKMWKLKVFLPNSNEATFIQTHHGWVNAGFSCDDNS